jgi:hypothetical protein
VWVDGSTEAVPRESTVAVNSLSAHSACGKLGPLCTPLSRISAIFELRLGAGWNAGTVKTGGPASARELRKDLKAKGKPRGGFNRKLVYEPWGLA